MPHLCDDVSRFQKTTSFVTFSFYCISIIVLGPLSSSTATTAASFLTSTTPFQKIKRCNKFQTRPTSSIYLSSTNNVQSEIIEQPAYSTASEYDEAFMLAIEKAVLPIISNNKNSTSSLHTHSEACRIFHGRGGAYPGCEHLTLDWFPPVWVLTSFREVHEDDLNRWGEALSRCWNQNQLMPAYSYNCLEEEESSSELESSTTTDHAKPKPNLEQINAIQSQSLKKFNWIYQCRATTPTTTQLMAGDVPNPHIVSENGNSFLVHVLKGQNHGLFLDMARGRSYVQEHAQNKNVLNLFSYTCAFSVAALQGGASQVVNVDMSKGALKIGQRNHEINNFGDDGGSARFLGHNVFKTWGKIKKLGPYDMIVVDPPSYQKGSFVAEKDYVKLLRRLPSLLSTDIKGNNGNHDGQVLLCLNAPELGTDFLRKQVADVAPELEFVERLENPSSFPAADLERALKVLVYRLKPPSSLRY